MKREALGKQTFGYIMAQCVMTIWLFVACSKTDDIPTDVSDTPIQITIEGWKPLIETRATIFENEEDFLNDDEKIGGNFTLHAYVPETGVTYIDGTRAWYFNGSWRFFDEVNNNFIQYYWLHSGTLDFFAYMPYKDSPRNKNIAIQSYDPTSGLTLKCTMQSEIGLNDADGQETIFAYTPNRKKEQGTVNMHFVHPFAAVYFKLKQAHRNLTINWIRFNNVYLQGTTTLTTTTDTHTEIEWDPQTGVSPSSFKININKTIPEEINFGGDIGGPYLVMPQSFGKGTVSDDDDVTITISYTWDDGINDNGVNDGINPQEFTRSITTSSVTGWTAGNKYTYILDLGDNKEEILFKVEVEPWIPTGDEHRIDIE